LIHDRDGVARRRGPGPRRGAHRARRGVRVGEQSMRTARHGRLYRCAHATKDFELAHDRGRRRGRRTHARARERRRALGIRVQHARRARDRVGEFRQARDAANGDVGRDVHRDSRGGRAQRRTHRTRGGVHVGGKQPRPARCVSLFRSRRDDAHGADGRLTTRATNRARWMRFSGRPGTGSVPERRAHGERNERFAS